MPRFEEAVLDSLNEVQIRHFVDRWYAHVGEIRKLDAADAQGRAELLKAAIFGSDRLKPVAERPRRPPRRPRARRVGRSRPDQRAPRPQARPRPRLAGRPAAGLRAAGARARRVRAEPRPARRPAA
ncbi:MAG: hypothetical protein GY719_33260 [bacterium]|nr:hypothetical protein [bacterium]